MKESESRLLEFVLMLADYRIFIPSISRAGKIKILAQFGKLLRTRTTLVTNKEQEADYRKAYPDLKVVVCPVKGIHSTRQWIMENTVHEITFMADDDLTLFMRENQDTGWKASHSETVIMFQDQCDLLHRDNVACVGIGNRYMINQIPVDIFPTGPYCHPMGFNLSRVNPKKYRFDRVRHYEDTDMVVQLMMDGLRCLRNTNYFHSQSPSPGGARVYRDTDKITESTLKMIEMAPEFIRVKINKASGAKTPQVQWKKLVSAGANHA
jgi:hypothetical protein